jgi:tetratricopeptide (TPR) repeat protein
MKLEHWDEAFVALGEATKHARETWQMWENYAAVAVKVEEYPTAARALDHMVSLTRGDNFDLHVLGSLTNRVHEHPEDKTLAEGLGKIFKKIAASSKGSGVAAFWAFYARYHETLGSKEASAECLSKQLRCLQSSRWHEEEEAFIKYSAACLALVDAYMANGNARELSQARMLLRNSVQRAKEYFDDHQCYMELCDKLEELKSTQ